jgi:hypothetical protein
MLSRLARGLRIVGETPAEDACAGFAAIDALVALTILAATLSLSLEAGLTARRAAARAAEIQSADTLLRSLIDRGTVGDEAGRTAQFAWRVEFGPVGASQGTAHLQLCRRAADAKSLRGGRHYKLATLVACPVRS